MGFFVTIVSKSGLLLPVKNESRFFWYPKDTRNYILRRSGGEGWKLVLGSMKTIAKKREMGSSQLSVQCINTKARIIFLPSYCNFPVREKIKFNFQNYFLFYSLTLNIICFIEIYIFICLRFYLRIFEVNTVKSDCHVQFFWKKYEIFKD